MSTDLGSHLEIKHNVKMVSNDVTSIPVSLHCTTCVKFSELLM